jgi:DNA repair protein RecN (Recombination protein N)
MLQTISVQNLVLIEGLTLELGARFNVLTGETGAGKSMLVDALGLVLGGRSKPEMVRAGAKEAEVEALFSIEANAQARVAQKLEASGVPFDGELVVRRIVPLEGRSRAYLNGRLCTAGQLAELAADLCDIASQHESVSLTDPATHMGFLDAFGGLDSGRDKLAAEVDALSAVARQLDVAREKERSRAEREDFLAFQLREIDDLDPRSGEELELEQEAARLKHAEKLAQATRHAADALYEGESALCDELARLTADLESAAEIDSALAPHAQALEAARSQLADAARELSRYADGVEHNPARAAEVDERLFRLRKILRKYGPSTVELLEQRRALATELEAIAGAADRIAALETTMAGGLASLSKSARTLSRKRREAADGLADAIGRELALLGMGRARVLVEVSRAEAVSSDTLVVDGARLGRSGLDRVEFMIAPNPGEEPRPLRKIASGGELSRALLALKRVLAEKGPAGLYVFDEVDAGVGGAIAEVIGRAIADVAAHRQVLCITHLPQIAALADAHFVVGKSESRGRTFTQVRRLTEDDRVAELARMIGGVKVTEAARRTAAEMLRR